MILVYVFVVWVKKSNINLLVILDQNNHIFDWILFLTDTFYCYLQRFTKNTFFVEKNPTIVNFPVK